jgi:hypothetical protein
MIDFGFWRIDMNMTDKNIVFGHKLSDAWGLPILGIEVRDTDKNNVICHDRTGEQKYNVSKDTIDEIYNVIKIHNKILSMSSGDIEQNMVLDGTNDWFMFSDGNVSNEFTCFNMWAFRDENYSAPNAKYVLDAFEKISEILIKEGIDKKYLKLD